jgi:hypothetical protein
MISVADPVFQQIMIVVAQLPLLLVWLVGLVLAIVRWARHPKVSGLVLVAVFAAAGATFGAQIVFRLVPILFDASNIGQVIPLISAVTSLIHACAWACLLAAAFGNREDVRQNSPFADGSGLPPRTPPKSGI